MHVPESCFDFHPAETKRTVALDTNHTLLWIMIAAVESSRDGESGAHAHGAERARVESMPRQPMIEDGS